jgi:four helix bundle protein
MSVADYKELRVYRSAFEAAVRIYELSRRFPAEEKYSLTDQVRRSSRAVCANIAEAWRKRRYEAAFISKLSDAGAEAAETEVWLDFALRFRFVRAEDHAELTDTYDHVCRQLSLMMSNASSWCTSGDQIREEQAEYFIRPPEPQP